MQLTNGHRLKARWAVFEQPSSDAALLLGDVLLLQTHFVTIVHYQSCNSQGKEVRIVIICIMHEIIDVHGIP